MQISPSRLSRVCTCGTTKLVLLEPHELSNRVKGRTYVHISSTMSHFQEQARSAYKRKEYGKALSLFDRAIGRAPSVQLYDNRAACHERLGDLESALKDAKKAIQLSKDDPTGFLRAGRVLSRMQKRETALEIYAYGLKNVKHVGQGYEVRRAQI
jgi:F-box/TPR repeat protein Pof3